MKKVHSTCYDSISEDCSRIGHKDIGADYDETMACIKDSFGGSTNYNSADNKVLHQMA